MRKALRFLFVTAVIALISAAWMYATAVQTPVVRRVSLAMSDWPDAAPPLRLVLLSDLHVAGPDMPPRRVKAIVEQVNALKPHIVLFAGDFVSDKRVATKAYPAAAALAPLRRLRAPLGTWAVLGNHDHWRDAAQISAALRSAKISVLDNEARTIGPLRLGGVDDDFTRRADLPGTVAALRRGSGSKVLLSHSPDVAARVPKDVTLILAGHTHCGQIRLPLIGEVSYVSAYGERYACGLVTEGTRRVVITAGLGTSVLPMRLGAAPDMWLVTLAAKPRNR